MDNVYPLKAVKIMDPKMNFNEERVYGVLDGPSESTWKEVIANSANNNSATFNVPPPSQNIGVGRVCYIKVPVSIAFTATITSGTPATLLQEYYDGFRAFPISSICENLSATINNANVSISLADVIHPLSRYNNPDHILHKQYSIFPSMLDNCLEYANLVESHSSPLAPYRDNIYARGGFPFTVRPGQTNTSVIIDAELVEPVFLSPFGSYGELCSFIGVQSMQLTFTWASNLSRLWSHTDYTGIVMNTPVVTLGNPSMLFNYLTPKITQPVPKSITYDYFEVQRYPNQYGSAIATGASISIPSANIQLNSIPRRMYLLVKDGAQQTYKDTDTYLSIENVSCNWANRAGLFSGMSQQQLYEMSVKNGLQATWAEFSGGKVAGNIGNQAGVPVGDYRSIGAPVCIEFGTDLGMQNADESAGVLGNYQLQITVKARNNYNKTLTSANFMIIVVSEGSFTIENGRAVTQIGVLTRQDVLDSKLSDVYTYKDLQDIQGGNFFTNLKSSLSKVGKFVKDNKLASKGLNLIADVIPDVYMPAKTVARVAAKGAEALGAGRKKKGGVVLGAQEYYDNQGGAYIAGARVGGKMMSRAELKQRLMQ